HKMKLEDQVCSLELAKKLKDLGVNQESAFYWVENFDESDLEFVQNLPKSHLYRSKLVMYSAFTVAELGGMLPINYSSMRTEDEFACFIPLSFAYENEAKYFYSNAEANARAMMLIYLIEKGIVKP